MTNTTKSEFFQVLPVAEALAALLAHWNPAAPVEQVSTDQAYDRVTASAVRSPIDLPAFVRGTMDGYAVRALDTFGASATLPAYLQGVGAVQMGGAPTLQVGTGEAAEIFTGAMLPAGADAVVMLEHTQALEGGEIEVLRPVAPGENVIQVGEDVSAGAEVVRAGARLRPVDIGGLLALGITTLDVICPMKIGIVGSGDEVVPPSQTPAPGQIRDVNSYTLAALFARHGAAVTLGGIAPDQYDALYTLAAQTLQTCDVLVLTAGSSISARDLTTQVVSALGAPGVIQHGLAVKPGKPTILAVCNGKPVIGLPGNPVSAYLVARQVVVPLIARWYGEVPTPPMSLRAQLTANIPSASGREDTVPVRLTASVDGWQAEPIFGKSNLIFTLAAADGLVRVPLNVGGLRAGEWVDVMQI